MGSNRLEQLVTRRPYLQFTIRHMEEEFSAYNLPHFTNSKSEVTRAAERRFDQTVMTDRTGEAGEERGESIQGKICNEWL